MRTKNPDLQDLIERVCKLHQELPKNNLVSWTSGNISGKINGLAVVIKPSGIRYDSLAERDMIVLDTEGRDRYDWLEQANLWKPSTDTESHLYIYRHCPEVNGICHTHSPYATAFAAAGLDIPCILTAMADEFGGPIRCTSVVAEIGSEAIGQHVVHNLRQYAPSNAILLKSHGVFTVGPSPEAAVKTAVMVEDVARTVWLATQLHNSIRDLPIGRRNIPDLSQDVIKADYERYYTTYGQRGTK